MALAPGVEAITRRSIYIANVVVTLGCSPARSPAQQTGAELLLSFTALLQLVIGDVYPLAVRHVHGSAETPCGDGRVM